MNNMDQSVEYEVSFQGCWPMPIEEYDSFDLRFLFDDEDILEIKQQLIEDIDRYFWRNDDDDEDELYENGNQPVAMYNANDWEHWEEENWDDEESNVRFIYGIGFIVDETGYDSGYDEPYEKGEEYPPWYDDVWDYE